MADWADGYVADVTYTNGFYRELTPAWLSAVALLRGVPAPDFQKNFRYCELGCGQGFGTALMAAGYPGGQFYGFDFNPAQIANASSFATEAGINNVLFHEASFAELADAPESAWPKFDFVVFHGIYSWVSRENQQALVRFAAKCLAPGGLLYCSYNAMPGCAPMQPVQHLMRLLAKDTSVDSGTAASEAVASLRALKEEGARYLLSQEGVSKRLDNAATANPAYLAHEYLNETWHVHHFSEVLEDMRQAKLDFVGSAFLPDNLPGCAFPNEMRERVRAVKDVALYESLKDLACNQSFRRDVFVRGKPLNPPPAQLAALHAMRFGVLKIPPDSGEFLLKTSLGEANANMDIYRPVFEFLASGEFGLADLHAAMPKGGGLGLLVEVVTMLMSEGIIHPLGGGTPSSLARQVNQAIAQRVGRGFDLSYLLLPSLGTAAPASHIEILALGLLLEGVDAFSPEGVALLHQRLLRSGRRFREDGSGSAGEDVQERLCQHLDEIRQRRHSNWLRLGLV